jgi:hypothetical protein
MQAKKFVRWVNVSVTSISDDELEQVMSSLRVPQLPKSKSTNNVRFRIVAYVVGVWFDKSITISRPSSQRRRRRVYHAIERRLAVAVSFAIANGRLLFHKLVCRHVIVFLFFCFFFTTTL